MDKFSYLGGSDVNTIDALYQNYMQGESDVDESWQSFFKGFDFAKAHYQMLPNNGTNGNSQVSSAAAAHIEKEFRVLNLINAYRQRGHLFTKTNPVRERRKYAPTLALENFGLSNTDLDIAFQAGNEIGIGPAKLRQIIEHLEQTYCASIGVEYLYIRVPEIIEWLQHKMEGCKNTPSFTREQKEDIFLHLKQAVGFEKFIHKKFVGQKRFSLEGAESLIPALDAVIEKGAELGIEEFMIGMPHRGRLTVLTNILRKPYEVAFKEFIGKEYDEDFILGDVKYHGSYEHDIVTDQGKKVHIGLAPNPSHLETVNPIVQGIVRAKLQSKYNKDYNRAAVINIHGDAAVAGQGVVYEVVQMAQLEGYKTGGTIHLVVNNQVGFTTNYTDARSSTYCTDVAKVTRCPVFHVNGDDVEAVVYVVKLAMEYRQKFHTDVFIDILGYRKYGHNEGDEPRFTQPVLYKIIENHPNPLEIYSRQLIEQGLYTPEEIEEAQKDFNDVLDSKLEVAKKTHTLSVVKFLGEVWKDYRYSRSEDYIQSPFTGIKRETLLDIARVISTLPSDKKFFNKIEKLIEDRRNMITNNKLDWGMCEHLAYGSILKEGYPVRISGQDVERGTFSHRHAALVIEDMNEKYFPLKNISPDQAQFHIFNSLLSEYGVMGFEYGYAMATPKGLTVWEAQFGDFSNVAQPIIDQYICSAEDKWGLMNGLVLLLPHGYEGQGPEHSSARVERFLAIASDNNMQIVNCTTPANIFHVLRRQVVTQYREPLIIFTPKSLLRHPLCVSTIEDLTDGKFREVIDDTYVDPKTVARVVYCTGKIYYDLLERQQKEKIRDVAIVRLEQMHPFPMQQIKDVAKRYPNTEFSFWIQEEPRNMGAWNFVRDKFDEAGIKIAPISRRVSGSPAVGLYELHLNSQRELVDKAFKKCDCQLRHNYCTLHCTAAPASEEAAHAKLVLEHETQK